MSMIMTTWFIAFVMGLVALAHYPAAVFDLYLRWRRHLVRKYGEMYYKEIERKYIRWCKKEKLSLEEAMVSLEEKKEWIIEKYGKEIVDERFGRPLIF